MTAETPKAFRRTAARWLMVAFLTPFLLICLSGFVVGGPDGEEPASLAQRLVLAPFTVLVLWIMVGAIRQGVFADADGLTVRNIFRTHRMAWDDIAAFERPPAYGKLRNTGIQIRLFDGRVVNAALYGAGPFNRPSFADNVVDDLRELHQQYGQGQHTAA